MALTDDYDTKKAAVDAQSAELGELKYSQLKTVRDNVSGITAQLDIITRSLDTLEGVFATNDVESFWTSANVTTARSEIAPLEALTNGAAKVAARVNALVTGA